MGVTGWYDFVRKSCPNSIKNVNIRSYRGKTAVIDSNQLMYKFCAGNEKGVHLKRFAQLHCELLKLDIRPRWVFDGKSSDAKKYTKQKRELGKQKTREQINKQEKELKALKASQGVSADEKILFQPCNFDVDNEIEMERARDMQRLYESEMKLQNLKNRPVVDSVKISEVKTLLKLLGAHVIQAETEGEATCATMNRLGLADVVFAEDSDVFIFGGSRLVRGIGSNPGEITDLMEYDVAGIMEILGLTGNSRAHMAVAVQSDFTSCKIKGLGPKNAVSKIAQHKTINKMIANFTPAEKKKFAVPVEFLEQAEAALQEFLYYLEMQQPTTNMTEYTLRNCDYETLVKFLESKIAYPRITAAGWYTSVSGSSFPSTQFTEEVLSVMNKTLWGEDDVPFLHSEVTAINTSPTAEACGEKSTKIQAKLINTGTDTETLPELATNSSARECGKMCFETQRVKRIADICKCSVETVEPSQKKQKFDEVCIPYERHPV